ncbi:MAG TPA: hypothetical protein VHH88_00925, partial [Verrucomicrobiae bacterium]|nr:hypothetical protein [Verrucomicrobiae bacterium]
MRVRLLCGPAGSGKTFRCLAEARAALGASPEGRPLILLAPRQSTYELERRILADSSLPGYTRLQILSFERLAYYIFDRLGKPAPEVLDEEGRVMALRGLLARRRDGLKLFRASARLAGFARQLSLALREFQTQKITPEELLDLSTRVPAAGGLAFKLHDLGALFRAYLDWLSEHNLQDSDFLLSNATEALLDAASGASGGSDPSPPAPSAGKSRKGRGRAPRVNPSEASQPSLAFPEWDREMGSATGLRIESLWVDGFAEFAPREIALLRALAPHCERATLTFCLDAIPPAKISWLSTWSLPARSFKDCHVAMETIPGAEVTREVLARGEHHGRFAANPVLRGLEKCWSNFSESSAKELDEIFLADSASLRAVECATPEAEAVFAAREILAHVRRGGRYREVAVLVRSLDQYHDVLERTFRRFDIPFFMDRREEVAHHPLAELTRNAIRTLAFDWESEDWFAALKSGLAPVSEQELDRLENLALERGWKRDAWLESPRTGDPRLDEWVEDLQKRLLPPFRALRDSVGGERSQPDGPALAAAIRRLWDDLRVESQLESWSDPAPLVSGGRPAESPHTA